MTLHVPYVGVDEASPPGATGGFLPVAASAAPAPPAPFWLLGEEGWRRECLPAAPPIGPLGLRRLSDVSLCGSGYLFSGERFVLENAHTSRIGLQWLQNPHFPDNPFTTPPPIDIPVQRTGLIVFGPGFPIWGHFLLDFLPRIALARLALGERFRALAIPVPSDAPDWYRPALDRLCGVGDDQLVPYDRHRERLRFDEAWLPDFAHDGEHVLHPFANDLFAQFVPERPAPAGRRLCLSRRRFERETRSLWRVFENREAFERMAIRRGYEIVCPEDLPLDEQIALFADATHLVGEFGSGMHNAVFCRPGMRVGCFPFSNALQCHIAAAGRQQLAIVDRGDRRTDGRGVVFYGVAEDDLEQLFDRLDDPAPEGGPFSVGS
ncbi:glycosyltransferase family 61 protein [Acetobacteraceae bacterium KSS8]|uniref:Glycosyltransferase family 61 protein n=1 Tax=Endosaccharibacter trunci TaxID=2812733 RepID=A0ABT1W1W2_9PROT|nr:glycosyltransferase family 61 protein [Acetobacteraceae bacterium KSS8]